MMFLPLSDNRFSVEFAIKRFVRLAAMLVIAAMLLPFSGCRIIDKKAPAAAIPSANPPFIVQESTAPPVIAAPSDPKRYEAFRPVMPEELIGGSRSSAGNTMPNTLVHLPPPPPPLQPVPNNSAERKEIDELNRKVQDLERQLAESKKREAAAVQERNNERNNAAPPTNNAPNTVPNNDKVPPVLPVINKPGVTISADNQRQVHIEVMDAVLFQSNSWQLTPDGEETLRSIAAEIKASSPNAIMTIEGHTDSLAVDPNNRLQKHDISSIKAMTVMQFFINTLRWNTANVEMRSCGFSRPAVDNGTPEGRARNNRIEFVVRKN